MAKKRETLATKVGLLDKEILKLERYIKKVETTIQARTDFFFEIKDGITAISQALNSHIEEETRTFDEFRVKIDKLTTNIDTIQNIRVNGSIGLVAVLQNLYTLTSEKRRRYKLLNDFREWRTNNPVAKIVFGTKVGILFFIIFQVFIILSVLHVLGVPVDPIEIIKYLFNLLGKIL